MAIVQNGQIISLVFLALTIIFDRHGGSVGSSVSSRRLGHLPGGCRFESHHGIPYKTFL